jgi:hypothetical protein
LFLSKVIFSQILRPRTGYRHTGADVIASISIIAPVVAA